MADAITRQVSEQVKRAMEAASSARPPTALECPLVHEGEPSHRLEGTPSPCPIECGGEVSQSEQSGRLPTGEPLGLRSMSRLLGHEERTLSGHTTTECRELKKALHELENKGQIDRFLKRGPRLLRQEQEHAPPPPREEECSTEVVATIAGGYAEGITRLAWKAQLRSVQHVLTAE
ncbi:hypothetical protein Cgig2_031579 [Carnegiea gigantea]|uniref:Uncharacterized protein n=1 Tax=Carnegiea gigantea TaxID=171969 RepID=A0A9Q1JFX8_9CARY|nr:hypothetical protein Cgig2_031579 [Carnegiea gigantea]